jgi:GAF domain-containing protein
VQLILVREPAVVQVDAALSEQALRYWEATLAGADPPAPSIDDWQQWHAESLVAASRAATRLCGEWLPLATCLERLGRGFEACIGTARPQPNAQTAVHCLQELVLEVTRAYETSGGMSARETERLLAARVRQLAAVHRVTSAANSSLDLDHTLAEIVAAVHEVVQSDQVSIFLYDPATDRLVLRATIGLNPAAVGSVSLRMGEGVTGWAALQGKPVSVRDGWTDPRFKYVPELAEEPYHSFLSVPIILFTGGSDKLIGVLNIQTKEIKDFTPEEVAFAETVAGQIAIAIENARLYEQTDEQLQEKIRQLATLSRVTADIARHLDVQTVLDNIASAAVMLSRADMAAIFRLHPETGELSIVASHGLSEQYRSIRVRVGEGAIGIAVATKQPVAITDALTDPRLAFVAEQVREEGYRSMFCVPLVSRDRVLGGISLYTRERHEFSQEQIDLLFTFANEAAIAIENAQLYEEAQRGLAVKDMLLKEMHHRVKNNLQTVASLLKLQMRHSEPGANVEPLAHSIARIESIAAVHDLLSQEEIGLTTVRQIVRKIIDIASHSLIEPQVGVQFSISGAEERISSRHATVLALVLNELIANAVTHGFEGRQSGAIRVSSSSDGRLLRIEVEDDGVGLPPGFDVERDKGLGLTIIHTLVTEDLKGHFELRPATNGGTVAIVVFPHALAAA